MKQETGLIQNVIDNDFLSFEMKEALWKTYALIDQPGYGLEHFFNSVDLAFSTVQQEKEIIKTFKQVEQCLQTLFALCKEKQNIKPAYLAAEGVLLKAWGLLHQRSLCDSTIVLEEYKPFWSIFLKIAVELYHKISPLCKGRDTFSRFDVQDEFEYPLRIFDTMGVFAALGITLASFESQEALCENIAADLMQLIQNNPPANTPLYDSHAIDIFLAAQFLLKQGHKEFVLGWLKNLISRISFAYEISGRHFPIWTDSYSDLLSLKSPQGEEKLRKKQELTQASTLFPILAASCVALGFDYVYAELVDLIHKVFPHTELQVWYPDAETENKFYQKFAGDTGAVLRVPELPSNAEEFKEILLDQKKNNFDSSTFSCFTYGFSPLVLLASRHFRTPSLPSLLQDLLPNQERETKDEGGKEKYRIKV